MSNGTAQNQQQTNSLYLVSYFLISLILITSFPIPSTAYTGDYHYVTTEMTPDDAEIYCIDTYGTHLSTLLTTTDLTTAQTLIGSDSVWVGLKRTTNWQWRDTDYPCNGDAHYCTDTTWWANLGEGSRCADMRSDKKLNDWSCTGGHGTKTFLCDKRWQECTGTDTRCHTRQGVLTCDSGYRYSCEWPGLLTTNCNLPCTKLTSSPTPKPTVSPTDTTISPTYSPSTFTLNPTVTPTSNPTVTPTFNPTFMPSIPPTQTPSVTPTFKPTFVTNSPTNNPTLNNGEGGVNDDIFSTLDKIDDGLQIAHKNNDTDLMLIIIIVCAVVIGCILIVIMFIFRNKKSKNNALTIQKHTETTNDALQNVDTISTANTLNVYTTVDGLSPTSITSNTEFVEMMSNVVTNSGRHIDTQLLPPKIIPMVYDTNNGDIDTNGVDANVYEGEGNDTITTYQTAGRNDDVVDDIVNKINKTKDMENSKDLQTTVNDVDVVQHANRTHGAQNEPQFVNEFDDDEFEVIDDNNVTTMGY